MEEGPRQRGPLLLLLLRGGTRLRGSCLRTGRPHQLRQRVHAPLGLLPAGGRGVFDPPRRGALVLSGREAQRLQGAGADQGLSALRNAPEPALSLFTGAGGGDLLRAAGAPAGEPPGEEAMADLERAPQPGPFPAGGVFLLPLLHLRFHNINNNNSPL